MRLTDYHMSFYYDTNKEVYFVDALNCVAPGYERSYTKIKKRSQEKPLGEFRFMQPKDAVAYAMRLIEHDQRKEINFWEL